MSESTAESPAAVEVLSELVQNQIAAGEVVERPASVVKELVENALDAGASQIEVELEEGGRQLIRVTDNGHGMNERDLALCIERHATSKIRTAADIFAVISMGFRGEALPSIGAVSRLQITSGQAGAQTGQRLVVEGGQVKKLVPAPPREGTAVEVRTLFYNTPARLKFLKQPGAEVAAVNEWITRIALARPTVGFRVRNGGKLGLDLPVHDSLVARISAIFGGDLAARLLPVHYTTEGLTVEGFAAAPPESRNNSRGVYTFLNRRWIRHRGLMRVTADAYQGSLPPRRFPFAVLMLTLDTTQVDVNVHPTKEEVRFENERLVVGSVRRAVSESLRGSSSMRELRHGKTPAGNSSSTSTTTPSPASTFLKSPEVSSGGSESRHESTTPFSARERSEGERGNPEEVSRRRELYVKATTAAPAPTSLSQPVKNINNAEETEDVYTVQTASPVVEQAALALDTGSRHRVVGQAGERYLIVEAPDGIRIIDQHAMHERWNYERLRDRQRPLSSQRMLLPVVVELSPAEAARFDEVLPLLRELGFEVEPFGVATLSISATPDIVTPGSVETIVRDMFADLSASPDPLAVLRDTLAKSLACRASVLFGQHLPESALLSLLDQFENAQQPLTCPHGRPTSIALTWSELERRFGRA